MGRLVLCTLPIHHDDDIPRPDLQIEVPRLTLAPKVYIDEVSDGLHTAGRPCRVRYRQPCIAAAQVPLVVQVVEVALELCQCPFKNFAVGRFQSVGMKVNYDLRGSWEMGPERQTGKGNWTWGW